MKLGVLLMFLIGAMAGYGQEKTIALNADGFYGVDDFNAVYYQRNNVLYKKSEAVIQQFYDVQLGELSTVDIINPLKVLLFYRDTQMVVILDNRLNERQRIHLSELQPYRYFNEARLAGERRLWLHDLDQNRIELFNYVTNEMVLTTPVMRMKVDQLHTDYNFCHVYGGGELWSYNSYGSRTGKLVLEEPALFIGFDFEQLLVKTFGQWRLYKFDKEYRFRESEITTKLPTQMSIKSLYLKAGKLYLWNGKQVAVYDLNPQKK
jgi:hypothetical protein